MEKASGIVIKRVGLNDNDVILTIFTKEKGKIQAIAKGAKKIKSGYMGTTQLFCYSNFVYYPGKTFAYLNQSELIESFYKLRSDLSKLSEATYAIELINCAFEEQQKDERILSLLLYTLKLINSEKTKDTKIALLAYQLKFMGFMGYAPQLNKCSKCSKEVEEYYFSKKGGGLLCSSCKGSTDFESLVSKDGLEILKTLLFADIKKIGQLEYNRELVKYLIKLMNDYITYHIDKKIYSYDFMDTI